MTSFRAEKGWGAIASAELPPGEDAWVHLSVIDGPGYRSLAARDEVEFRYEQAAQDGFRWRATWVRRI